MICTEPIACANVERVAYLFFQNHRGSVNVCFGKFIEQENDAGEFQFVFLVDKSVFTEEDLQEIVLPGIDLFQDRDVYVRSYEIPYFVECSVIPKGRGDLKEWMNYFKMDYYDPFVMMLRSRAITHHTNCYLGCAPDDFEDANRIKRDVDYAKAVIPHLREEPENVFHRMG